MSLSTSNTKVEHYSIESCISNGFAAMSKAITFHCQAVSLADGTTQWPPHVCTCKIDAATESPMQNDPWSNHPATAPWFFFPYCILIHSDPLWSTPIHSVLGETDNLWCDGPMPHQTPRASGVRRAVGMRGFKDSRKMFVAPPKDCNNYDGELNCVFLVLGIRLTWLTITSTTASKISRVPKPCKIIHKDWCWAMCPARLKEMLVEGTVPVKPVGQNVELKRGKDGPMSSLSACPC